MKLLAIRISVAVMAIALGSCADVGSGQDGALLACREAGVLPCVLESDPPFVAPVLLVEGAVPALRLDEACEDAGPETVVWEILDIGKYEVAGHLAVEASFDGQIRVDNSSTAKLKGTIRIVFDADSQVKIQNLPGRLEVGRIEIRKICNR